MTDIISMETYEDTTMKTFHRADAIARTLYPSPAWDTTTVVNQLRAGVGYMMNIFTLGYLGGLDEVRKLAGPRLQECAARYAMGELDEVGLSNANHQTLAAADIVGMPISPRAAFCRGLLDTKQIATSIRQELGAINRPLTMKDVEQYYQTTYFSMTPVSIFLGVPKPTKEVVTSMLRDMTTNTHLVFNTPEIKIAPLPEVDDVAKRVWNIAEEIHEVFTKLLDFLGISDPDPDLDLDMLILLDDLVETNSTETNLKILAEWVIKEICPE